MTGCNSDSPRKPAPIGDHAVLEQLATSYRSVSDEYPTQPASMRPKGRKEFVKRVFEVAGYNYGATLSAFAKRGADVINQDHRDLAELMFLPHRGVSKVDMEKLYSTDELQAIRAIEADLK